MSTTYITVRDRDGKGSGNGGRFFINEHSEETGRVMSPVNDKVQSNGWGQHDYQQKRQARRAAKALAIKLGIDYRQDKEYRHYDESAQIINEPVTV